MENIIIALENNNVDFINNLLKSGYSANMEISGQYGFGITALHIAASYGYIEMAETLLNKGANVNTKNKFNFTSLDCAELNGHFEMVKLLKNHGGK